MCTSSPLQTPASSGQDTPSLSSIDSAESTICPNSPSSDTSIASSKDYNKKLKRYQRKKSKEILSLRKKIIQLQKEKDMYRKKADRLIKIVNGPNLQTINKEVIKKYSKPVAKTCSFVSSRVRNTVQRYYENDENSRLCPGKKDCITKNKLKKTEKIFD